MIKLDQRCHQNDALERQPHQNDIRVLASDRERFQASTRRGSGAGHHGPVPNLVEAALHKGSFAGHDQPRLSGQQIVLRPWQASDVRGLVEAYADPDVQRWHCQSLDDEHEAASLIDRWNRAWAAGTGASWAVVDLVGEPLLGRVGLRSLDLESGAAEIAYWVLPSARRRGVASAAVSVLCAWAFGEVGFHRLAIMHAVANTASCGVATASGFAAEGTLRGSVRHADGWHDMHLHARLRSDEETSAPGR